MFRNSLKYIGGITLNVHHIGYAVKSIKESINDFIELGFTPVGEAISDTGRNIEILFLENGDYCIELVAPMNNHSPVSETLRKSGNTPYHICYMTCNLANEIETLKKSGYIVIADPLEAPAINNKKVAFLYKINIGLIELVEE